MLSHRNIRLLGYNANQLAANTDEGYSYSRYFIPNGEHSKKEMPIQRTDKIKYQMI